MIVGTGVDLAEVARIRSSIERFGDRFRDRIKQFPDVRERVIRYMIVENEVGLERRTQRRDGGSG